ncbi:MAG: BON domain-containing protein [Vicinamibacterales bacterium]
MTDRDFQQHVQNALDWEPSIDAADIGVSVDNGVVTAAR